MITAAIVILAAAVTSGCAGGSSDYKQLFNGKATVVTQVKPQPNGSTEIVSTVTVDGNQQTTAKGDVQAPKNADEGSTLTVGNNGVELKTGKQQVPPVPPPVTAIQKNSTMIYTAAGILGLIAAVILFAGGSIPFLKKIIGLEGIGMACGAMSAFLFFLPTFIEQMGFAMSVTVFIGIILFAVIWIIAKMRQKAQEEKKLEERTNQLTTRLVAQGQPDAAVTARSTLQPNYKANLDQAKIEAGQPPTPPPGVSPPAQTPEPD